MTHFPAGKSAGNMMGLRGLFLARGNEAESGMDSERGQGELKMQDGLGLPADAGFHYRNWTRG